MKDYDNTMSLMTRIAWMHYIEGMTHAEIAGFLGFSRSKVTKLLLAAKDNGIVEININSDYKSSIELEDALKKKTNLSNVIVVPDGNNLERTLIGCGKATADYLNRTLQKDDILGLAWGKSFVEIIPYLKKCSEKSIKTVQLMGGFVSPGSYDPQTIISEISARLGAIAITKAVPAIVETSEIKDSLLKDSSINTLMGMASQCTKSLMGIGSMRPDLSSLCKYNILSAEQLEDLKVNHGIVGDVMGWFIDKNGDPVHTDFSDRFMSPDPEILKKIPEKIIKTSGVDRLHATVAAIKGGWVDTLIIDEDLAIELNKQF